MSTQATENKWAVSVADGKYTVQFNNGKLDALRHSEPWQDLTGNNLVYWLAVELQTARDDLVAANKTIAELQGRLDSIATNLEQALSTDLHLAGIAAGGK